MIEITHTTEGVLWLVFALLVVTLLALDVFVLNRTPHAIAPREAIWTSIFWIGVSLAFNALIFHELGVQKGLEFFTGYVIEKALSVDNIFVFVFVFSYFKVPPKYQHRVLFLGIVGAIVFRSILIAVGATLIHTFQWMLYLFGIFLLYTAYRFATQREAGIDPASNPVIRLFRRVIPVCPDFAGQNFIIRRDGAVMATPLLVVLIVVETTDVIFALDSIPAILAITTDPFIVLASNIFAVLGLRALYFVFSGVMVSFRYLKTGVAVVLGFCGIKILVQAVGVTISLIASLVIISLILIVAMVASVTTDHREKKMH